MNDNTMTKKLIAVVGPTGSGKTALAVELAQKFNGVIVSADSRQVYKGLNIGSNKEGTPGDWQGEPAWITDSVPQLLIDIAEPGTRFTLHDWLTAARKVLPKIWAAGKIPIVCGGTGLYVTALLEGYVPGEGRYSKVRQPVEFQSLILEITVPRTELNSRSDARFARVFDLVVAETNELIDAGVPVDWLENLGLDYRFASYFLRLTMNREMAIAEFQQASRAYIRRQLTWWRHHGTTVPVENNVEAIAAIKAFVG